MTHRGPFQPLLFCDSVMGHDTRQRHNLPRPPPGAMRSVRPRHRGAAAEPSARRQRGQTGAQRRDPRSRTRASAPAPACPGATVTALPACHQRPSDCLAWCRRGHRGSLECWRRGRPPGWGTEE